MVIRMNSRWEISPTNKQQLVKLLSSKKMNYFSGMYHVNGSAYMLPLAIG